MHVDESTFPLFNIDLDKRPEDRFTEVIVHFREPTIEAVKVIMTQVPDFIIELFDYTYWFWSITQPVRYREIKGIVKGLDTKEITLANAIMTNCLYELQAWCTSIVAQSANGTILHSRNLDFDNADDMRKITFRARFFRKGKEIYEAVMFAGNLGVYTGIKHGAYSIS